MYASDSELIDVSSWSQLPLLHGTNTHLDLNSFLKIPEGVFKQNYVTRGKTVKLTQYVPVHAPD